MSPVRKGGGTGSSEELSGPLEDPCIFPDIDVEPLPGADICIPARYGQGTVPEPDCPLFHMTHLAEIDVPSCHHQTEPVIQIPFQFFPAAVHSVLPVLQDNPPVPAPDLLLSVRSAAVNLLTSGFLSYSIVVAGI